MKELFIEYLEIKELVISKNWYIFNFYGFDYIVGWENYFRIIFMNV